jgi:DNA-binding NarL/FixJ family response regulator
LINLALKTAPDLDVLVITAIDDSEIVDSAQQAGAMGVFSKPIHFNELLSTIHGLDRGGGARHRVLDADSA